MSKSLESKKIKKSLESKKIKVTLVRGLAGCSDTQRKTIYSLGLRKIGSCKILPNLNPILGQINKVIHLIRVDSV